MLEIVVGADEAWDEATESFTKIGGTTVGLEHSLVSLSKWESKHEKPFLNAENLTSEEILDYIRCMVLDDSKVYLVDLLDDDNVAAIRDYIEKKHTATFFSESEQKGFNREIITSELIYFWMVHYRIPFECQNWHLNRLVTLVRVCSEKNKPPKKMSPSEIMARNRELNRARLKARGTKG